MDHETAVERLRDLVEEHPDETSHAALLEHLNACEDCQRLAELYRDVRAVRPDADGHLTSEEIVEYAVASGRLTGADRVAMDAHVESCDRCRGEVELVRRAEAETFADEVTARRSSRLPIWFGTLAASVAIALLAYPAYLGLVRVPEMNEAVSSLESENARLNRTLERLSSEQVDRTPDATGAVDLWVLSDRRRDRAAPTEITLVGPDLLLAVDLTVPTSVDPGVTLAFELLDGRGVAKRTATIAVSVARDQIRRNSVLAVRFPADGLDDGAYRLRVQGPGEDTLFEASLLLTLP